MKNESHHLQQQVYKRKPMIVILIGVLKIFQKRNRNGPGESPTGNNYTAGRDDDNDDDVW